MTEDQWIDLADGVRLHVSLWIPDDAFTDPAACLIEALPYRKDDLTHSYASTYEELVRDGRFAVCRVDLRGTGSSQGIALDEYPTTEVDDLTQVIKWLAAQAWCSGRIGMFGTSYSGFNSLHLAAAGVPELGAVCAIYSSDDRFTDDVHYSGGALRAVDVVDYVSYMVAMNALPPVPAIFGPRWRDEWRHRIANTPPWVLGWLRDQTDGPNWRRGSIRMGPDGAGYERISCPTMLVGGWADGYRNNTLRTVAELSVPWRLLLGPWSHQDTATARPGPHIELVPEMIGWFDEHLRGGPSLHVQPIQVFVREWTAPEPDQPVLNGQWRSESGWPLDRLTWQPRGLGSGIAELDVRSDVGVAAWISCAGALPWGQPLDQRSDDAWSITTDWSISETTEILGHARAELRVKSSAPVAYVSAKLCAVGPDGTSALITRGLLNLTHRHSWPASPSGTVGHPPTALVVDEWYDVSIDLEATSWVLRPGDVLRLSLAGTDWPNVWPPPEPLALAVDRAESTLRLPVAPPMANAGEPRGFVRGPGPAPVDDSAVWRIEHDVLARETRVVTGYGSEFDAGHGAKVTENYRGVVGVATNDPGRAWAEGTANYCIEWPEGVCRTSATVRVDSDAETYHVKVELIAHEGDVEVGRREWTESVPRQLQ